MEIAVNFQRITAAVHKESLIRVGCFYVTRTIYRIGVRFRGAASLVGGN